jgi:DNA-binding XRE family transcriptional regulator
MARYDGGIDTQERRAAVRLVQLRRYREMSQQRLADAAGMPRFALQAVEAGNRNLRLGEAIALCEALGVELGAVVSDQPLVLRSEVRFE